MGRRGPGRNAPWGVITSTLLPKLAAGRLVAPTASGKAPPAVAERFFDLAVDMLCVAGTDGYFKTLNPAWTRTLGFSHDELLSHPYLDFVHPADRDATIAEASKIAGGFETIHFRNRYQCKDGSYKWLAWTASPAMADGSIYAAARDITNIVLAEEEGLQALRDQLVRVQAALQGDCLRPVFQPIVNIRTNQTNGWEALSRFDRAPYRPPDQWFAEADAVGLGSQLEIHAIRAALAKSGALPAGAFLSVNVSPDTLLTSEFSAVVAGLDGTRLVVEVTEHAAVEDYELLKRAIDRLRLNGVRLAIDDAGAGFASLKHIVKLLPEFVKLDLFLIRNIDSDPAKRALTSALVAFGGQIGSRLIAEGVESAGELRALAELGIDDAQGYHLGRPGPLVP
jgi:PAS domain S-box-containing protein